VLEDGEPDQSVRNGVVDDWSAIDHDDWMHTYRCTSAAVIFYRGMYNHHGATDGMLTRKKVAPFLSRHGRQCLSGNPVDCHVNHFRTGTCTEHFTERQDEGVRDVWSQGDVRTEF
jgi:hypothetical protein